MAYGDPFDSLGTDRPPTSDSFLGQSPDFWSNLANFGWGTVAGANQRLPSGHLANPGVLGATAAGYLGAGQLAQQAGMKRSELVQQGAQTEAQQLQNYMTRLGLPLAEQTAQWYSQPGAFSSMMQGAMGLPIQGQPSAPQPQPAQQASPTGGTYADSIKGLENPGGKSDAINPLWPAERGGPLGDHQLTRPVITGFAAENPQLFQGMTPDQISASRSNPDISTATTNWLAGKNAPALKQSGIPVTPQSLAIAHALGGVGAAGVLKFPDETPMSQALSITQPNVAPAILQANPQYQKMTVGQLKQKYANVSPGGLPPGLLDRQIGQGPQLAAAGNVATDAIPQQGAPAGQQMAQAQPQAPMTGPPPVAPPPGAGSVRSADDLMASARQKRQQAQMMLMSPPQMGLRAAAPAMLQAAQQDEAQANAINLQSTQTANQIYLQQHEPRVTRNTFYPEGAANPTNQLKTPELTHSYDAAGNQIAVQFTAGSPGEEPKFDPVIDPATHQPFITQPSEGMKLARTEYQHEDSALASAQATQGWLAQMSHSADMMGDKGWTSLGPTAPERLQFSALANEGSRILGLPQIFDPNAVGFWEEMRKATQTAGMQLAQHMGGDEHSASRVAAQTIVNTTNNAVPGEKNSPLGFRAVMAGINEVSQQGVDLHDFKSKLYNSPNLVTAENDFYKQFPAVLYAKRAISYVKPYPIKGLNEVSNYLPGTFLQGPATPNNPTGRIQVPARPGAPPVPDYLKPENLPQAAPNG